MSKIDFEHIDGHSSVARDSNGRLSKLAMPVLALAGFTVLAYVNWPSGLDDGALESSGGETFETSNGSIDGFAEKPPEQAADPDLIQIPSVEKRADPATVNVTVNEAEDLNKLLEIEEARRRAEEERRLQEEARRRAEEAARQAELDAKLHEEEEKARWARLRSAQIVIDGSTSGNQSVGESGVAIADDGQLVRIPGADSDANKAFLEQSEQARSGMVSATRFDRTDALIAQGTMIRGFLETAINTDLPGMLRAVVREDVRSLDGSRILIPKGSRLIGEYKSGLARGQKRVFVVWSRVIRADGISVDIASPGADALGRAGLSGQIDTHFWERFGTAIMLSVIGGASEFVASLGQSTAQAAQSITTTDPVTGVVTTITAEPTRSAAEARSIGAEKASTILQDIAKEAFRDSSKIPPTIYVAQGEPVIVYLRRDVDFSSFYADPVRQELMRLKQGGAIRRSIDPTPYYPPVPIKQ